LGDQIKKMRLEVHVARMARGEVCIGFRWGNLRGRDHLEDLGVDGLVILKMYLQKLGWGMD